MNFSGSIRINKCGVIVVVGVIFLIALYNYTSRSYDELFSIEESKLRNSLKSKRDSSKISLREILIASIDVAERGGLEVVRIREEGPSDLGEKVKGKTEEGAKDRVTEGDFNSHRVMFYGMRKAFPKVKVISEEHTENQDWSDIQPPRVLNDEISNLIYRNQILEADDVTVWIDPLDATQEYTENLLEYVTTMVCVAVSGVPLIGVIHRPFQKETYWAIVEQVNSPNLEELFTSKLRDKSHDTQRIIVSRSHAGDVKNITQSILSEKAEIISAAGAGYKALKVISGEADVYLHVTTIKKWDTCAGNALLNSLGGSMITISGDHLDYSAEANTKVKGILAYLKSTSLVEELKKIKR